MRISEQALDEIEKLLKKQDLPIFFVTLIGSERFGFNVNINMTDELPENAVILLKNKELILAIDHVTYINYGADLEISYNEQNEEIEFQI